MDSRAHTYRRSHPHIQGAGELGKRELNTSSGSLVERATGLAPHRLICESLSLNSSVPLCTRCVLALGGWGGGGCFGGGGLSPICTLINLQKHLLNAGENRQYLHVKFPRTSVCLAKGATAPASVVLQILGCTRGMIMTSSVQLLLLPITLVMMERNTLLTLLALSTRPALLKSGLY